MVVDFYCFVLFLVCSLVFFSFFFDSFLLGFILFAKRWTVDVGGGQGKWAE